MSVFTETDLNQRGVERRRDVIDVQDFDDDLGGRSERNGWATVSGRHRQLVEVGALPVQDRVQFNLSSGGVNYEAWKDNFGFGK